MKRILVSSAVALALLAPTIASAADRAYDTARWMSTDAVAQRLIEVGFAEVQQVERDGKHYAVTAVGPDGVRVAFHVDPAIGDLVHVVSLDRESKAARRH